MRTQCQWNFFSWRSMVCLLANSIAACSSRGVCACVLQSFLCSNNDVDASIYRISYRLISPTSLNKYVSQLCHLCIRNVVVCINKFDWFRYIMCVYLSHNMCSTICRRQPQPADWPAYLGRSGGVRSTIEEQLVAILSAGKYSSDFNAKKIVSVARPVPEISSVDWSKVGPFFTQKISWKAFIEPSNNGKFKVHNWQISTKNYNLINWNAYSCQESIHFLEGKILELHTLIR